MLLGVIATIMVLSVVYPALYVSSFNPAQAIKKGQQKTNGRLGMKNMLVVVQFVLSVVLIISTLCVSQQLRFINNYDLGYNHANLIYLPLNGEAKTKYEALKNELNTMTGVISLTCTSNLPIYGGSSSWGYDWEGKSPDNKVLISKIYADRNFIETMGIKMAEGDNFPESYADVLDSKKVKSPKVLLNQEAIRRMQLNDPVGKYFGQSGSKGSIAGVVQDFHFQSLHSGVEPLVIVPLFDKPSYIVARISPTNFSQTIADVKQAWKGILPQSVCEVKFIDDGLESMYKSEMRISGLFRYFSFIAIFISSIGLFGLSLFIIERRRKEIGVRKVNGAKIGEVMFLLNRDFVRWVIVAFVVACPIAWLLMHRWLENFAFKTTLSWWIFALAGALALIIALLTVSWQTYRAAVRNPVEALRYE